MKAYGSDKLWGVLLACLGAWLLYGSLSAVSSYFVTGAISWGRPPRQATGELALIFHGIMVLAGAALAAKGVSHLLPVRGSRA